MPTLDWNKETWGNRDHWDQKVSHGESWSKGWGTSEVHWKFHLLPRLQPILAKSGSVLEVAPGYGRWTRFIAPYADRLTTVDLNENCIEHLKTIDLGCDNIEYFVNDGMTLTDVPDQSVDFIFSYDSLVHCDKTVLESYLSEFERVLRPDGFAFFHHSNLANARKPEELAGQKVTSHARDPEVSGEWVKQQIDQSETLELLLQENVDWGNENWFIDCYSVLRKGKTGQKTRYSNLSIIREKTAARKWFEITKSPGQE